jgi:TonB-dependent starch-binding outer membrane protein SusC
MEALSPLYVIDGVQILPQSSTDRNPIAGLNPNDIETMEILQGPSATAIYGSRATNGVVLITTKRGKSGEIKVNYNFLYVLQDTPKKQPVLNLREYAQMVNEANEQKGWTPVDEFVDPSILSDGTDWQEELFKQSALKKHQLSLSGGAEKTKFYLSGEYFDQEGVAQGSNFDRYSVRLNLDNQTKKWLKFGLNLNLNQTKDKLTTSSEGVILNALQLAPNIPVRNPDGSWGGADEKNGTPTTIKFSPINPVALSSLIDRALIRRQALGGLNAEVNLLKGLVFRTALNGNIQYTQDHRFLPTYKIGDRRNDLATLEVWTRNDIYWNWNQVLQYDLSLNNHSIGLMLGHEAQKSTYSYVDAARRGFLLNDLPVLSMGNADQQTNGGGRGRWGMESYFGRLNYSYKDKYIVQATGRFDGSANFAPENRWGFFPSASAAWRVSQEEFMQAVPLIKELKLRYEAGLTGNQGWNSYYGPLSSVATPWGAGFILSRYGNPNMQWEETLTNNLGFNLSILNNRVQLEGDFYIKKTKNLLMTIPLPSYMGTQGRGAIGAPTVNVGEMENRGYGITLNTVNIDRGDFRWITNFNISGFKSKISKLYTEASFLDRNWGIVQRASLNESPWLFRGFIEEGLFQSVDEINNSALPVDSEGKELKVGKDGVWVGDVKFKDVNNDGVIDASDITTIGNPWPKFNFGFTNTFSYKGFGLSALLVGVHGNDVYNDVRANSTNPDYINLGRNLFSETFNYARVTTDGEGNPVLENPGTNIPRIIAGGGINANYRTTQKFVEDGSYIRIKNITLDYNLPKTLLDKHGIIKGVRVSVGVQNIATFTKYKGFDPEVGGSYSIGYDNGRYPTTPSYTFSLNVDL